MGPISPRTVPFHELITSMHRFLVFSALLLGAVLFTLGAAEDKPYEPKINGPSNEGEQAIARFRTPKELKVSLWAAEPMLANPVCFAFDEKGRMLRRRDIPPARRRHRHPRPHELARRRPRLPHRRRSRQDAGEVRRRQHQEIRRRTRSHPPARRHQGRRQGRQGDRLRRRLQPRCRRHRRRSAGARRQSLVHLHSRPLAARRHEGNRQGRREEIAGHRLRRPRRLSRPRSARPAHGTGRQDLFQHRRPRHQRDDR